MCFNHQLGMTRVCRDIMYYCYYHFDKTGDRYSEVTNHDGLGYVPKRDISVRRDGSPHTVTQEQLVWPLDRAVCEIGGALGLYLGFSVLSLLHAARAILAWASSAIISATNR